MSDVIDTVQHSTQPRVRRRGTINYAEPTARQADDSNVDQVSLALTLLSPFVGLVGARGASALRTALIARRATQQARDPNPFAGTRRQNMGQLEPTDASTVEAHFEPMDYEMFQQVLCVS